MKHHSFTPLEALGYIRICRPGSVIGPQQNFVVQQGPSMAAQGEHHRRVRPHRSGSHLKPTLHAQHSSLFVDMNPFDWQRRLIVMMKNIILETSGVADQQKPASQTCGAASAHASRRQDLPAAVCPGQAWPNDFQDHCQLPGGFSSGAAHHQCCSGSGSSPTAHVQVTIHPLHVLTSMPVWQTLQSAQGDVRKHFVPAPGCPSCASRRPRSRG